MVFFRNGKKLPFEVDLDYTIGELKNKLVGRSPHGPVLDYSFIETNSYFVWH